MTSGGDRARRWAQTLGEFALSQGFGQAAGMLAGLIYVRWLPVEQYALYALCLVALSVMAVGSDMGLTGSLTYFWRKSQQEASPIAPKIALVRRLRGWLYGAALMVGVVLVATSTRSLPLGAGAVAVGITLVAATAWVQTRIGIDILLVRLEGRQRDSYYYEAAGSAARLTAALAMVATGLATAWFGLAGGLAGAMATLWFLRRKGAESGRISAEPTGEDWREMRTYALPLVPSVVVYMMQDPIVMWLAAARGGAVPVAEVHALGRISAILSLMGTFSYVVAAPRLARISDSRRYLTHTFLVLIGLGSFGVSALLFARSYPAVMLAVIGGQYAHLDKELLVAVGIAAAAMLSWTLNLANRGRGWVALDPLFAGLQITLIVALCLVWPLNSSAGVLSLMLALALSALVWSATTFCLGIFRPGVVLIDRGPLKL